jgi:pentafunctional AROM polypeptide
MHNTGFEFHQLKSRYELCETDSIDVVAKQLNESDTLGGSVTIPHKQAILPYMHALSPSAAAIGNGRL